MNEPSAEIRPPRVFTPEELRELVDMAIRQIDNQAKAGRPAGDRHVWLRDAWDGFMKRLVEDLQKKGVSNTEVERVNQHIKTVTKQKADANEFENS